MGIPNFQTSMFYHVLILLAEHIQLYPKPSQIYPCYTCICITLYYYFRPQHIIIIIIIVIIYIILYINNVMIHDPRWIDIHMIQFILYHIPNYIIKNEWQQRIPSLKHGLLEKYALIYKWMFFPIYKLPFIYIFPACHVWRHRRISHWIYLHIPLSIPLSIDFIII